MFGISGNAASSFLCGTICGFPLGAKSAVDLYNSKQIDKKELELLCSISGNPSCAFVISGIGAAMYNDALIGVLLYFSVIFSACLTCVIFKIKSENMTNSKEIIRQSFSLVNSIQKAGMSSITISSYIIFFSALISLLSAMVRSELATGVFSMLLEISCASLMIAKSSVTLEAKYVLTAFSLGFSGMSMQMQAMAMAHAKINRSRLIIKKALQGILAAAITLVMIKIKEALHI